MQIQPTTDVRPVFISTSILPGALFAGRRHWLNSVRNGRPIPPPSANTRWMGRKRGDVVDRLGGPWVLPRRDRWHVAHPGEFDRTGSLALEEGEINISHISRIALRAIFAKAERDCPPTPVEAERPKPVLNGSDAVRVLEFA